MSHLIFGLTPALSFIPYVAKEKYVFKDHNLEMDFRTFLTGKKTTQALQKGWVDVGNIIDINIATLALEKKPKIKLLACTQIHEDGQIIARGDSHIKEPSDLMGKRLGYMPHTSSHIFIEYFARHYGLNLKTVELIPVRTDQMGKELLLGNIDACSIWEPHSAHIRLTAAQENIPLTRLLNTGFFKFYVMLGASEKIIKKKTDDIHVILKALDQTVEFAEAHPKEAAQILAKIMKLPLNIFEQLQTNTSFKVIPIPDDFWTQVEMQLHWISPSTQVNYEKYIDKLTFFK